MDDEQTVLGRRLAPKAPSRYHPHGPHVTTPLHDVRHHSLERVLLVVDVREQIEEVHPHEEQDGTPPDDVPHDHGDARVAVVDLERREGGCPGLVGREVGEVEACELGVPEDLGITRFVPLGRDAGKPAGELRSEAAQGTLEITLLASDSLLGGFLIELVDQSERRDLGEERGAGTGEPLIPVAQYRVQHLGDLGCHRGRGADVDVLDRAVVREHMSVL